MADLSDVWWQSCQQNTAIPEESCVSELMLRRIEKHFFVEREVHGTHMLGPRVRIDAVITPRDSSGWKNKDVRIGLEFKRHGMHGIGDVSKAIAQAADYANSRFIRFGVIPIFVGPNLFMDENTHRDACRIAGRLGVGDLRVVVTRSMQAGRRWTGVADFMQPLSDWACPCLELRMNGHLIWSESEGVVEGSRWNLERKFGAR